MQIASDHCIATRKIRYPDAESAEEALQKIMASAEDNKNRKESRIYWCEFCFDWHITSQYKKVKK